MIRRIHATRMVLMVAALVSVGSAAPLRAGSLDGFRTPVAAVVPATFGWFDGEPAPYLATEASDQAVAASFGANYVPRLGNAANTAAVDDIYVFANAKQANVIPSRPKPAGPRNKDGNYTPLWQVSAVTWNAGNQPYLLTSERAILSARDHGLVTIAKTNIVVNCSVIFTPSGGLLPGAKLLYHRPN